MNTVADVLALRSPRSARATGSRYALPGGRALRAPGPFVRLSRTPVAFRRPAPGGRRAQPRGARRAREPSREPRRPSSTPRAALAAALRGRQDRRLLVDRRRADHRQVPRRPRRDGRARRDRESGRPAAPRRAVQGQRRRASNRCQFFGSFNTSKLSLALNLKQPDGLEVAKRLLGWADVCLDSFTAGTMAELGLGYEVARALNPRIIMASTCLMGQTGPAAALAGYGYHAAAVCGFYEITGWDDRPPGGSVQRLHRHDRAALSRRDADGRARPSPPHRRGPVHRSGADGVVAVLPRARSCSTIRCSGRMPAARRQRRRRPPRRTTPTRAPATTSGARSPSRPTRSGAALRRRPRRSRVGDGARARHGGRATRAPRGDRPRARRVHRAATSRAR